MALEINPDTIKEDLHEIAGEILSSLAWLKHAGKKTEGMSGDTQNGAAFDYQVESDFEGDYVGLTAILNSD